MADTNNMTRDKTEIRKAARKVNVELAKMGRVYYDKLPVGRIIALLEENDFDTENLEGIWCGHEGRVHESIGDGKFILVAWCRVGDNGRFELTSYVS